MQDRDLFLTMKKFKNLYPNNLLYGNYPEMAAQKSTKESKR